MRLNLDAGELPDEQPELWAHFDILNIACGGHAGDPSSMTRLVDFCVAHSIAIGAHPSYPDRDHFGRRSLSIDAEDLHASLVAQLRSLSRIAHAHGARVEYVKPHGALYHDASRDPAIAVIVVDAIHTALGGATHIEHGATGADADDRVGANAHDADERATIIGPRGDLESAARAAGFTYAIEGFADRAMRPDGSLVPRSEPNALITSPSDAAAQARTLAHDGTVDTICLHADTPGALDIARAVRAALAPTSSAPTSSASTTTAPTSSAPTSSVPTSAKSTELGSSAFVALGDRAVRFARPRSASSRTLVDAIKRWPGVVDVVIARQNIAAYFARPFDSVDLRGDLARHDLARHDLARHDLERHDLERLGDLERRIEALASLTDTNEPRREVELRAIYDGPDLDDVARACGLSSEEVVDAHVGAIYEVDMLGFAPGFAYLVGVDPRLRVPRRSTPRERVPAGALAIAGEYTAVYPFVSPGGWNLIGRVDEKMFDPDRGARLQLGDRVRFTR